MSSTPGQQSPLRQSGATLAMIEGRSGRAVIANTIRDLGQLPAFAVARLKRRDRREWVFGNIHGFRDSPRYLAEHILHERPDLHVTWIALTADEANAVRKAGLAVALRGQSEAKRAQLRAGVAVFTHGFRDLDLQHLAGARLIFVWHGTPLKRIGLDVGLGSGRRRSLGVRAASSMVRWVHRRSFGLVSRFVAAGTLEQKRFMSAFAASAARVPVLGSPRFDVIRGGAAYDRIAGGDLRAQLGYSADDQIVLWLPTHRREGDNASWLPTLEQSVLDEALRGSNLKLLVKPHPRAAFDVFAQRLPTGDPRVRLMRASDTDVNCLLHIADALISDYSSVVCDYAILGRPLYYLAPDVDEYLDKRGLYDPYETMTDGRHHADWASLLAAVRNDFVDHAADAEGAFLSRRMNDYLGLDTDPASCARIVETIASQG